MDSWKDEFEEKVGIAADLEEMSLVLWQIVDDKTHDLLLAKGFEQFDTPYEDVTRYILAQVGRGEEREVLRRPANRDRDGDVQMFNLAKQDPGNPSDESEEKESDEHDEEDWSWYYNVLDAFKVSKG